MNMTLEKILTCLVFVLGIGGLDILCLYSIHTPLETFDNLSNLKDSYSSRADINFSLVSLGNSDDTDILGMYTDCDLVIDETNSLSFYFTIQFFFRLLETPILYSKNINSKLDPENSFCLVNDKGCDCKSYEYILNHFKLMN